ncbi:alpha/beta fold hydrolase [Hymenobacter endophyticus]|uniref:Alpha/beta hydrolase n=1 Tax=Hymenobacter endophyticus TaxID=3076335 RepID=A0ABU3TM88_9BACT|nr:alpha/beta hydrolase [Hymenobacter endophyticus]MDU0372476.1 alpha/beta hydrolase [Hymenobacter endophyticus]
MLRFSTSAFRAHLLALLLLLLAGTARAQQQPMLAAGSRTILTSDSVKLFVQVAGQGTPCLFVHGGPGAGSYSFEKLGGSRLEDKLQMVYLDQRGSGRSGSSRTNNYSMARMVQDMEELRQQLGLQKWVVMAHSFGGTIATAYAQKYPQRVQALVLTNAVLNPVASLDSMLTYGTSLLPATARPTPSLPQMQRFGMVMGALQQQKLAGQLQFSHDSLAVRAMRASRAVPGNPEFAQQVFSGRLVDYGQDYAPATAKLTMPTLVIVGQDDRTTGATAATYRFPRKQVVTLPGKHNSFLEQPAQFRQAVVSFVQQLPR